MNADDRLKAGRQPKLSEASSVAPGPTTSSRLRPAITIALEALEDGDQRSAVDVLLAALEDGSSERRYLCEVCGAGFEWPGLLQHHVDATGHAGEQWRQAA